jgi:hypothetical protein
MQITDLLKYSQPTKLIMDNLSSIEKLLLAFDKTRRHTMAYLLLILVSIIGVFGALSVNHYYSWFDSFSLIILFMIPIGINMYFISRTFDKTNTEEQIILNNIIRERYYENYLSVIPEGNTPIEKFLSIAKEIFPQIKIAAKNSKNITIRNNRIEIDYKDGTYIIKQFDKSFSINDLKEIIKKSTQTNIFRYIVLGTNLTESTQDKSFEKIMENVTKVDLVTINDDDFKMEWIS